MSKSIKKNYVLNLIYEVFALLVPIFVMPYISRVLGAGGVGVYSYTYSIVYYFMLVGALGFTTYATREIAKRRENDTAKAKIFWEVTILKLITCVISAVLYEVVIFLLYKDTEYFVYLQSIIIYLIGVAFDIVYYYRANEDFDRIVYKNIFIKVLGVVLVFVFIKTPDDLYKYVMIQAVITIVSNALLWFTLPKSVFKNIPKKMSFKPHLKPALKLFVPTVASSIYTILDKTLIGVLVTETVTDESGAIINVSDVEIGMYEQTEKLVKMLVTIMTSLSVIISPRNSYYFAKKEFEKIKELTRKTYSYVMLLSLPMVFGVITVSSAFCPLFLGSGYDKAPLLMNILAVLIVLISLSGVFGMQYLSAIGEDNKYIFAVSAGAVVNVILNIILIPHLYSYGAAIATVIAETLILILLATFARKMIDFKVFFRTFFKYLIGALLMFCATLFINFDSNVLTIVVKVMTAVLVYGSYLVIIRDDMIVQLIHSITSIFKRKRA